MGHAMAVGGAIHQIVVHNEHHPVAGHVDIGLDHIHAQADGALESVHGVFRCVRLIAAVRGQHNML